MPRNQTTPTAAVESLESRRLLSGDFDFAFAAGGGDMDTANAVATDSAGNIYVGGIFRDSADFDPTFRGKRILDTRGKSDGFLAKYTPTGRLIWAKQIGGEKDDEIRFIQVTPQGLFVGGVYEQTVDFDPGAGVHELTSLGGNDIFIAKYTIDGDYQWAKSVGGADDDQIEALTVGPNGDAYYGGTFRLAADLDPGPRLVDFQTQGVDDTFVSRLRGNDGSFVFARTWGEEDTREDVRTLAVNAGGDLYMAGVFSRTVAFNRGNDAFTHQAVGEDDIYLARLSPTGSFKFLRTMGSEQFENVAQMKLDPAGSLLMTGTFSGQVNFNPGGAARTLQSIGDTDAFVARYNANGLVTWVKQFGAQDATIRPRALALDSAGNVFTTGGFTTSSNNNSSDGIDFDPGKGVKRLVTVEKSNTPETPLGASDAFDGYILKLNKNGNFVSVRQFGGTDAAMLPYDLVLDPSNNLITVGTFSGYADLNPNAGTYFKRSPEETDQQAYLIKLLA